MERAVNDTRELSAAEIENIDGGLLFHVVVHLALHGMAEFLIANNTNTGGYTGNMSEWGAP
jgi:hypothetical protein